MTTKPSFLQTPVGQLLATPWFLPSLAAGISIYRSVQKKRSSTSLVLHAAGSAVAITVAGMAVGMSGVLE